MLSNYVVETEHEGIPVYFNTVTKKYIPKDSSKLLLEKNHFLKGSEKFAINEKLSEQNRANTITLICTWECNLRCTHCTVLKKLVKKDLVTVPVADTINFIRKFAEFYPSERQQISFIGGEPLLNYAVIDEVINILGVDGFFYSTTTNLAIDLNQNVIKCLSKMNTITISIDGDHEEHNSQRKTIDEFDPFLRTFDNLKSLIKLGFKNKISIQSALRDDFINNEHKKRYFRHFLKLGIKPEKILFGCHHPTEWTQTKTDAYKELLSQGKINTDLCCKFRKNSIVIDKTKICTDYYSFEEIGTIYDDIKKIDDNRTTLIKNRMPVLQDDKCNKCSVIGACWGGCTNGLEYFENPSKYCNQKTLIEEIKFKSRQNEIVHQMKGTPCL